MIINLRQTPRTYSVEKKCVQQERRPVGLLSPALTPVRRSSRSLPGGRGH